MKNIKFLLPLLIFLVACSTKEQYEIKGKIENAEGKMLYFEKLGLETSYPIDSVELSKNGEFSFKGDRLVEPTFFLLKLSDTDFITLLADSIEVIDVSGNGEHFSSSYSIQNSIGSAHIQILNKRIAQLSKTVDGYLKEYSNLSKSEVSKRQEVISNLSKAIEDHKDFVGKFVMENSRSFASYYALFQRLSDNSLVMNVMLEKDQMYFSTIATSLDMLYPESERVKHLYNYVLRVKVQQRSKKNTQQLLESSKRSSFPEIEQEDINGNKIKLSSLKGKVIILSFWASWNEPSRKVNKTLKSIYKKYNRKGLEIYQVSLDRSKVLWENAIENEKLPWINVSDLRYTESFPARLYNVKQLPANFIINRKGEIVGKDLFGQRLVEKMEELFQEK